MSSTIACQISSVSVRMNQPQPSETAMNRPCENWISLRGSKRSARAPDSTENSRKGSQCETTANPPSAGELNFWNITQ